MLWGIVSCLVGVRHGVMDVVSGEDAAAKVGFGSGLLELSIELVDHLVGGAGDGEEGDEGLDNGKHRCCLLSRALLGWLRMPWLFPTQTPVTQSRERQPSTFGQLGTLLNPMGPEYWP